jgi:transposase
VAVLNPDTGELQEQRLGHEGQAVEQFYRALEGIESVGYAQWFHALIQREGHTLLVGDATQIRAMVPRKTKTDRRDAAHVLQLLVEDRFPVIGVPDPRLRDRRALVTHRMRLVRMRVMVKNGLHAIALNHRLAAGRALFTRRGRAPLQALAWPSGATRVSSS